MLKFVLVKGKTELYDLTEKGKFQAMHGELSALGVLLCLEWLVAGTVQEEISPPLQEEKSVTAFKGLVVKLITWNVIGFQC